jgi:hypothetical protein
MQKIMLMSVLTLALAASGSAFAQSPTGVTDPAAAAAAEPQKAEQQSPPTIEKITQDLQKAGFSDVKVLEDAFLVQAKTKDGNPILMTVGPNGVSALEFSKASGATPDRTVQASPGKGPASAPAKPAQQ